MGKALAIQAAKTSKVGLGGVAAIGAIRAFSGKLSTGKARLHTTRPNEARAVEDTLFGRDNGIIAPPFYFNSTPLHIAKSNQTSFSAVPPTSPADTPTGCSQWSKVRLRGFLQCRIG